MNLREYLTIMALGTAVALSAWCVVVLAMNPLSTGPLGLTAFFGTLFPSLIGVFTIVGTIIRNVRTQGNVQLAVTRSLRQGLFLGVLVVGSLILMTLGLLTSLSILLCVAVFGVLEFFFLTLRKEDV